MILIQRVISLVLIFALLFTAAPASNAQDLTPLNILILDIADVIDLIGVDNTAAITILKSAKKTVRKVKEFDGKSKRITNQRIKKGIKLLKKDRNDEARDLLQTGIDELEDAGLISPGLLD